MTFAAINAKGFQRGFGLLMGKGVGYALSRRRLYNDMVSLYRTYHTHAPHNFVSYFIDTSRHCFVFRPFYDIFPDGTEEEQEEDEDNEENNDITPQSLSSWLFSLPLAPGEVITSQCHGIRTSAATLTLEQCASTLSVSQMIGQAPAT